ncbi:hypothetical protein BJY00DRAFT_230025 [Aspergillus carlsbadensis]|nr:hypothetical protein BJY00DRAFT_230025 [Aspergillus carlsbadensis]
MGLARGVLSSVLGVPDVLGQLAAVKLKQEASSHQPNLRRCLGHHGVFIKCVSATQEHTPPSRREASNGRHVAFAKPQRTAATPNKRAQISGAFKSIGRRRAASQLAHQDIPENSTENNTLSRVQARAANETSNTSVRNQTRSRTFQGLNPFIKLKQMMSDKAVS